MESHQDQCGGSPTRISVEGVPPGSVWGESHQVCCCQYADVLIFEPHTNEVSETFLHQQAADRTDKEEPNTPDTSTGMFWWLTILFNLVKSVNYKSS